MKKLEKVKKNKQPRVLIVDSQAVKNTKSAGIDSKGYCHYKCTNGIKRHLAVDTLGIPLFLHCSKASLSDDQGLIEMFTKNINYFKNRPDDLKKLTILLDQGYHPKVLERELLKVYPEIMQKIQFEVVEKPAKGEEEKAGFIPSKTRWVIERSNSWMEMSKSLVKNFEKTLEKAEAKIMLCFMRICFNKLSNINLK